MAEHMIEISNMEKNEELFMEKMGFPRDAEGLELSDEQLINFLLLCYQGKMLPPEDMEETEDKDQDEVKKEESKKEVAAKKILKKMGDKGRYDSANQLKTLIVMQVLGNSKSFFEAQQSLDDIEGFFTDNVIPDAELTTNNIAQYFLFAGSDGLMDEMIMQQWHK